MRITFFGLTLSSSWGNGHATPYRALLRALRAQGHQLTFFEKDVPYYARHRDFSRVGYCDLVLYPDYGTVSPYALIAAGMSDVVVVGSYCPDGARIADDLLRHQEHGPMVVYYDLDAPVTVSKWRRGEEVEYVRRDQIARFDLVLSFTGGRILDVLQSEYGARMARPLYGCVDPDAYRRVGVDERFACHLSYMGTYAADRQAKVHSLFLDAAALSPQRRFMLAGSMYPFDLTIPTNVRRVEHVSPDEHPALYSSSNWTLNITRAEMAEWGYCPSGRFFEAAACGCTVVTDEWEGLETFFATEGSGRELLLASSTADVLAALVMDAGERDAMARLARARALDEHTGTQRAEQFIRACEEAASTSLAKVAEAS